MNYKLTRLIRLQLLANRILLSFIAFLFGLVLVSCSTKGGIKSDNKLTRGKNNSVAATIRHGLEGNQATFVNKPKWNKSNQDYIYASKCQIKTTDLNSAEIISALKGQVLSELAEQLEVTIESIFASSLQEKDGIIEDDISSIIRMYSTAKFTSNDFELVIIPDEKHFQNGDEICVEARLNKKAYSARLEQEKRINELTARNELDAASVALNKGNMSLCLSRLAKCKYYIDLGGGGILVPYYKNSNAEKRSVASQHEEMVEDIRKLISFDVVGHSDFTKITFTEKENRILQIRLFSNKGEIFNFQGTDLELISAKDQSVIKSLAPVDFNGIARFDLSGINLGSEKRQYTLRPKFIANWAKDNPDWEQGNSYKNFLEKLRVTDIGIIYNPFPRNSLLPAVIFGQGLSLNQLNSARIHAELQSLIAPDARFFNLLLPGTGLSEAELVKALSSNKRLTKHEIEMLTVCNMILRVSVERHIESTIFKSSPSRYELSMAILSVSGESIIVLGSSKLEGNYSEAEILGALDKLYSQFMDEYFYRAIKIQTNVKIKHKYTINGITRKTTQKETETLLDNLSRFHPLSILHEHPDYRPAKLTIAPINFSHNSTNVNQPQMETILLKKLTLVPKNGSLLVNTYDKDTGKRINQNARFSGSRVWQTRFFFLPTHVSKKDSNNVTYSKLTPGYYTVIASEDGYTPSLPKVQYVYDDMEHPSQQSIDFYLSQKSSLVAIGLSTLAPGAGHYYLDKPIWQVMVPAVAYSSAIIFTWQSFSNYQTERNLFLDYQSAYSLEIDPDLAEQHRQNAETAYDDMQIAKTRVSLGVASIVATNVLTDVVLYIQKKFGK